MLAFNWALLIIVTLFFVYLGVKSKSTADSSEEGYLLGGRGLGAFVAAGTIVATAMSGWAFIGSVGVGYQYGFIQLTTSHLWNPAYLLAVFFFADRMRKRAAEMKSLTIPEYIEAQHGKGNKLSRVARAIASILTIIFTLVLLVAQVKALGVLGATWLGVPYLAAIGILMAVIVIYTLVGGLLAVAWSDVVMVVGMAIGVLAIIFVIFTNMSISEFISSLAAIDPALVDPQTAMPVGIAKVTILSMVPYAFMFTVALPYMSVRFMSIRKDTKIHHIGLWVFVLTLILSHSSLAGPFVRATLPPLNDPDTAMPVFLENYLNPFMYGVITLFILFATKSTVNSLIHNLASAISYDLRQLFYPSIEEKTAILINRAAVVLVSIIAVISIFYAPPFMLAWLGILGGGTLAAGLFASIYFSTFWRGNAYGAIASMIFATVISACFLLGVFPQIGWYTAPVVAAVCGAIIYYVVSKLTFHIQPRITD